MDKVAALPKEIQEEVLVMVTDIEEELDNELDLSSEDLIAIEQSEEEVRAGRTVPLGLSGILCEGSCFT